MAERTPIKLRIHDYLECSECDYVLLKTPNKDEDIRYCRNLRCDLHMREISIPYVTGYIGDKLEFEQA